MTPPVMAPQGQQQNAALFAQMAGLGGGPGAPQGMPQGGGAPPMGMPPGQPPPQMPPGAGAPQGGGMGPPPPPQGMPPGQQGQQGQRPQPRFTPQELAMLGRYGDTIVAHLTPGEIAVPPQVQTPKVLATIKNAFEKQNVDPQQFTAGSPQSSMNPQTGIPEYNFLSAFLPMALGIAGGAFMPGLMPALSPMLAGSIGTGLGGALGGILGGKDPMQSLLGGAGAGLGSYALGSMMSPGTTAAGATAAASQPQAATSAAGLGAAPQMSLPPTSPMSPDQITAAQQAAMGAGSKPGGGFFSDMFSTPRLGMAAGAGLGGLLGESLYTPQGKNAEQSASERQRFPAPSGYGNWQESLGNTTYKGPQMNFQGYNAADPNSNRWNFYPTI